MKASKNIFGIVALGILLAICTAATAGRFGGALRQTAVVPAYQSLYYDIPFFDYEPGIVTITGNGISSLDLYVYDGDGHVVMGSGFADRKAATLNLYRGGTVRVEVRNLGGFPNTFVLTTN